MRMQKKQIGVEDLEIGMFVVELDRPWLGTSFDFRGFPIATREQLDSLRACCRTVFVDPERRSGLAQPGPCRVRPGAPPAHSASLETELPVASEIYEQCERAARISLAHLRGEGDLEPEKLADAIAKAAQSMRRDPDAMLLLGGVREKSDRQIERALNSSILMMAFGRFLDFDAERLEMLGLAGVLLDVGKNCIPDDVLDKAGMLTPEEYGTVKRHVVHSAELVRAADGGFPDRIEEIILEHHERPDGSGYPYGLEGDRISLEGSIAGIVDSFSALTLPRAFAEARAPASALNLLDTMRGKCFDDTLIEQFIQCVGGGPGGQPGRADDRRDRNRGYGEPRAAARSARDDHPGPGRKRGAAAVSHTRPGRRRRKECARVPSDPPTAPDREAAGAFGATCRGAPLQRRLGPYGRVTHRFQPRARCAGRSPTGALSGARSPKCGPGLWQTAERPRRPSGGRQNAGSMRTARLR
jgi:HD-GYP domain-containing protein (c-di-GMP phosphodiesterase class II)